MCGIFGRIAPPDSAEDPNAADAMRDSLRHRGPDAAGAVTSRGVTLGNVRLSIIDLTTASDQPFCDPDGALAVVQNGEIYNYLELREELRALGAQFRTTGDTEVILEAYRAWGPDFVTRLNGMFAIALHDRRTGETWLYRDRLGVKPLYIAEWGGAVFFASEIKALFAAGVPRRVDHSALAAFFALNYVPAPRTAFAGIRHLPPAHRLRLAPGRAPERTCYWDLGAIAPEPGLRGKAAEQAITALLDDATGIRLRADAAFGAFLSGGLDSSSVVGAMRDHIDGPIRTYSMGFADPRFDETAWAKAAAARFATTHTAAEAAPDIAALWPRFIWHTDQPHGDVSFMPTDRLSALAARDVKMVLTGDGGDELFAGYEKYRDVFPAGATEALTPGWAGRYARASGLLGEGAANQLLAGPLAEAWGDADPFLALTAAIEGADHQDPINRVLLADTTQLLPGNNLVKPDRMAMANSLEVRSPYLDYRMAELAFRIPGDEKLAAGETKAILKSAVLPRLGHDLTYRKKQMFTVPVGEWFKTALAGFCREMLLGPRFAARGLFAPEAVGTMIADHAAGRANHTRQIRALISLEIWFRLFIDQDPATLAAATA